MNPTGSPHEAIDRFCDTLWLEDGLAKNTLEAYRRDLRLYADWLAARGWEATDAIDTPGTFARRGGILDLFATDWDRPVRVELFGDEIESLRTFDTVSQRSVDTLDAIDLTALVRATPAVAASQPGARSSPTSSLRARGGPLSNRAN